MMTNNTKLGDKLEGSENYWPWKYRTLLNIQEAWLVEEVAYLEGYEDKVQEGLSKIQEDYFHLHWISHVSSLKTSKEMFDALTKMYGGNNMNMKMTLSTKLKGMNMYMSKTIQY